MSSQPSRAGILTSIRVRLRPSPSSSGLSTRQPAVILRDGIEAADKCKLNDTAVPHTLIEIESDCSDHVILSATQLILLISTI